MWEKNVKCWFIFGLLVNNWQISLKTTHQKKASGMQLIFYQSIHFQCNVTDWQLWLSVWVWASLCVINWWLVRHKPNLCLQNTRLSEVQCKPAVTTTERKKWRDWFGAGGLSSCDSLLNLYLEPFCQTQDREIEMFSVYRQLKKAYYGSD